jgi:dolichyl-phosphate-mannose-protein mannosyltransferase
MTRPTKSGTPTPAPAKAARSPSSQKVAKKHDVYTSEGVADHDIFLLPGSDYQVMIAVTVLATIVRLFRIYQPSSVVFDEVQYVFSPYLRSKQC